MGTFFVPGASHPGAFPLFRGLSSRIVVELILRWHSFLSRGMESHISALDHCDILFAMDWGWFWAGSRWCPRTALLEVAGHRKKSTMLNPKQSGVIDAELRKRAVLCPKTDFHAETPNFLEFLKSAKTAQSEIEWVRRMNNVLHLVFRQSTDDTFAPLHWELLPRISRFKWHLWGNAGHSCIIQMRENRVWSAAQRFCSRWSADPILQATVHQIRL